MNLHGCTIFSKIDLIKAYHHIPVAKDDIHKTAVTVPFGLFEFTRMPYGLRNAAQTFQRFMNKVTDGLDFIFVYVDDILVASRSESEHFEHLRILFQRLSEFDLRIKPSKCEFGAPRLNFLSHEITKDGIRPSEDRIVAIRDFPPPTSIKQVQRFIGMVNYYHRFIVHLAEMLAPIHQHLAHCRKNKKAPFIWTTECSSAFDKIKSALVNATLLVHPLENAKLAITTDCSGIAMGAVLEQHFRGRWYPLSFFSRKLSPAEQKYSAYDRELYAIYCAIKHFEHFVESRPLTVFTDHKPLTYVLKTEASKDFLQARRLSYISRFTNDIQHIKGASNVVADTLSRPEDRQISPIYHTALELEKLVELQESDSELKDIIENTKNQHGSYYQLKQIPSHLSEKDIWYETSTGKNRPYIPSEMRRNVFDKLHGLSHPGIRATRKLLTSKYFWPSINRDTGIWCKTCVPCQKSKINRHTRTEYGRFNLPSGRFENIHMDLVGPLPPSNGYSYILTIIDRYTRWPEAIPLPDMKTSTVVHAFIDQYISRYGVPSEITTDQGGQFESHLFSELSKLLGSHKIRTTSYHPISNGMVERFHRTLKSSLYASKNTLNWSNQLPFILLGIRTSIKSDLECTPAELVYGQTLKVPGELLLHSQTTASTDPSSLIEQLKTSMRSLVPQDTRSCPQNNIYVPKDLFSCDFVFVRVDRVKVGLTCPYEGPYRVIKRLRKYFIVEVNGKNTSISLDRLKPAYLTDEVESKFDNPKPRVHFAQLE